MKTRSYFTRALLIEASAEGIKWDYNRQLSEKVSELPEAKFPVVSTMEHRHRRGEECEPHVRCELLINPAEGLYALCDMPFEFFSKLPQEPAR